MDKRLEKLLPTVPKPARYVGGELNSVMKDSDAVDLRFAFCFPDSYEIGMSHLGLKILYSAAIARFARDNSAGNRIFYNRNANIFQFFSKRY